jgi:hypothetical protein
MNDYPLPWKISVLRGQLMDLGSAIRQLRQSGLDSATAQLLMSRKRAELEDLMNMARGVQSKESRSDVSPTVQVV